MREILSYLFALLPAVYAAWWGRYLVRHLDDPTFPELHLKKIQRLAMALVFGIAASLLTSNHYGLLKVALVVLGITVADFPYRRRIFQESWSLLAYLIHNARFLLAYFGSLMLYVMVPEIAWWAGDRALQAAAAATIAYLLWSHFHAELFPRVLGAVPLRHPELEARFAAVQAKAHCRAPKLWRAGPPGGNFVNGFALPSFHRPGVVFSNTLLEALGPREMTAVYAHEVCHLEHYHRRRLLRRMLLHLLALAAVLSLIFYFGPTSAVGWTLTWLWPLANLFAFTRMQTRNQAHEHESDLRAVELCGDPQAVADGLLKIHVLSAMPRRWSADNERRLSHPSLAQRLRAIREAGGGEPEPAAGPEIAVRAADDPTRAVVLAADRLHWLSGLSAGAELDSERAWRQAGDARAILYSDLADLRLHVAAFGGRQLIATDRHGQSMKLPLKPEDVARVKAAVERLDRHVLGTAPEAAPEIAAVAGLPGLRLEGLLAMLVAMLPPFSGALALAALLVLIRPAASTLAAAGVIGTASAALGWWRSPETWLGSEASILVVLAAQGAFGLLFLWQAWRWRRRRFPDPSWTAPVAIAAFAAFSALSAIGLAFRFTLPYPLLQIHRWARPGPALLLLLLGIAAVLWTWRRWAARLPALGLAALALALAAAGTTAFRERLGGDPLRTLKPRLALESSVLEKLRSVDFEGSTTDLALSPSGERLAAATWHYEENEDVDYGEDFDGYGSLRYLIETGDGSFVEARGRQLEFLDEDRVAVLTDRDKKMWLEVRSLAALTAEAAGEYRIELPLMANPQLRLDGSRWQVTGAEYDPNEDASQGLTRLSGVLGEAIVDRETWNPEGDDDLYFPGLHVNSAGRVLALGSRFGTGDMSFFMFLPFLGGDAGVMEVATLGPDGQRHLFTTTMSPTCLDPEPGQLDFLCLTSGSGSTQLWSADPEAGRFTPIGSLEGDYWHAQATGDGRLVLTGTGSPLALVDPAAGRASLLGEQIETGSAFGSEQWPDELEGPGRWFFEAMARQAGAYFSSETLTARPGLLAVAVQSGEKTRVDVYRLAVRDRS